MLTSGEFLVIVYYILSCEFLFFTELIYKSNISTFQECHRPPVVEQDVNDPRFVWYCSRCAKSLKKMVRSLIALYEHLCTQKAIMCLHNLYFALDNKSFLVLISISSLGNHTICDLMMQGFKTFFMLNTAEHVIYPAQKC